MDDDWDKRNALVRLNQPLRAAAYVRMSTEHQCYSIDYQIDIIERYAKQNFMRIVQTYTDEGKSGLDVKGRKGLQRLLEDVRDRTELFEVILVQDVTRWGRFQDTDEAAYYEHICKRLGYPVHYCAEPFENDTSPVSAIMKSVKRAMAGEFSRELSVKIFAAQSRLASLGYRQTGAAGLGLRRMLLDKNGNPRGILEVGDHKRLQSDRVILVPGPKEEVELIKSIFDQFVSQGKTLTEIANSLAHQGIPRIKGGQWTCSTIKDILQAEKYIGTNIYGKTSTKLKSRRFKKHPSEWVRKEGAFEAIVDPALFQRAQVKLGEGQLRYSIEDLLRCLRQLLDKHGYLDSKLIDDAPNAPCSHTIRLRFGSLRRAFELAGYVPHRHYRYLDEKRRMDATCLRVAGEIAEAATEIGATAAVGDEKYLIRVNDEITVRVIIALNKPSKFGFPRWLIHLKSIFNPDIIVGVRMDKGYHKVLDYYVLPISFFPQYFITFSEVTSLGVEAFRFDDFSFVPLLAERFDFRAK